MYILPPPFLPRSQIKMERTNIGLTHICTKETSTFQFRLAQHSQQFLRSTEVTLMAIWRCHLHQSETNKHSLGKKAERELHVVRYLPEPQI